MSHPVYAEEYILGTVQNSCSLGLHRKKELKLTGGEVEFHEDLLDSKDTFSFRKPGHESHFMSISYR